LFHCRKGREYKGSFQQRIVGKLTHIKLTF